MKFGKNFSFYKIPEYSEYYLDYYSLKLFLRFIDNRRSKKNGLKKLKALNNTISSKEIQYKKLKTHQDEIKPLKEEENNNKNLHKKEVKKANSSNINDINNINEDYNPDLRNKEKDEEMNSEILEEKSLITLEKKNEIIKRLEGISDLLDTLQLDHFMKFYSEKLKIVDEFFIFKLNEYHEKFDKIKETIFKKQMIQKVIMNIMKEMNLVMLQVGKELYQLYILILHGYIHFIILIYLHVKKFKKKQ